MKNPLAARGTMRWAGRLVRYRLYGNGEHGFLVYAEGQTFGSIRSATVAEVRSCFPFASSITLEVC